MGDLVKRFGRRVASCRADRGYTQDQLAQASGISLDMISKIKSGRSGARFPTIDKLADALGVDAGSLFWVEPNDPGSHRRQFQNVAAKLSALSDEDLAWVDGLLIAALKPRRATLTPPPERDGLNAGPAKARGRRRS